MRWERGTQRTSLWVRWYTSGLPSPGRDARRREIASDLAEHAQWRESCGWGRRRVALESFTRTARGVPADLAWRRETQLARWPLGQSGALATVWSWLSRDWPTLAGLALGLVYLIFSLFVAGVGWLEDAPYLRGFSPEELSGRWIGAVVLFVLGLALITASLARLLVSRTASLAMLVVALPALPFFWMVVPTVLASVVIIGAVTDLMRLDRSNEPTDPAASRRSLLGWILFPGVSASVFAIRAVINLLRRQTSRDNMIGATMKSRSATPFPRPMMWSYRLGAAVIDVRILRVYLTRFHAFLLRLSRGRLPAHHNHLVLSTTGRKSGKTRHVPLFYIPDEGRYVVVGSRGGSDHAPIWWLNLQADPQATIEIRGRSVPVVAAEASAEERERLWPELVAFYSGYDDYVNGTERHIPVLQLTPTGDGQDNR